MSTQKEYVVEGVGRRGGFSTRKPGAGDLQEPRRCQQGLCQMRAAESLGHGWEGVSEKLGFQAGMEKDDLLLPLPLLCLASLRE